MDEYSRFRSQQSPRNEAVASSFVSPPRNGRISQQQPQPDMRSSLSRRFTTDSSRVPTLSSVSLTSPQHRPEGSDYMNSIHKVQLIEKKKAEYERIREQRRQFELEMAKLDQQSRREAIELAQMEEEMTRVTGHQSEPTTPPEHYSSGWGSGLTLARPARSSMSSYTSPGLARFRSGSQLMSPPATTTAARHPWGWNDTIPSRSVPTTRRNSDDEEREEAIRQNFSSHRSSHAHRLSMPVTRSGGVFHESDLDGNNTTAFLFGSDEVGGGRGSGSAIDESFPTLVRHNDQMLSASSAALDLALSSSPNPEVHSGSNWSSLINRHRTQQSLSALNGTPSALNLTGDLGSIGSSRPASLRHSVDLKYISENGESKSGAMMPTQTGQSLGQNQIVNNAVNTTPPKLQTSYSANEVPMIKNASSSSATTPNANNHAQQHFQNHNASMGRIPAGAMPPRHTRDFSGDSNATTTRDQPATYQSLPSALHGNAPIFGPSGGNPSTVTGTPGQVQGQVPGQVPNQTQPGAPNTASMNHSQGVPNGFNPYYHYMAQGTNTNSTSNYNMSMVTASLQQMNMLPHLNGMNGINGMNGVPAINGANGGSMYPSNQPYPVYGHGPSPGAMQPANQLQPANQIQPANQLQPRDSQARVIQNRRQADNEVMTRFTNAPITNFVGQIYELCKDQHGCRYLQKKLEERDPETVHLIWSETNIHVIELMTDPFGNYLCQKLLEFCNDDERTVLIQNAAQDMVRIALNQHGTRALQKMIEFVSIPQQIHLIIEALRYRVVELIQDLNGNHVIQKCLNKLTPADAQFIFDAVGNHCIEVGTHRHGCCVLQRCIDHASGDQKHWLIARITNHAQVLVQDPFGNYVVQYIIDLNEPAFTEPIVATFQGCVGQLSRHKFSSNVIEKCLRCALPDSKDMIVREMLAPQETERLMRDSFANYVIQTALDYATDKMKLALIDAIRPILPTIRTTPYGRRIQAKISAHDNRTALPNLNGQGTPSDSTSGQLPLRNTQGRNVSGNAPPQLNSGGNSSFYQNTQAAPIQNNAAAQPQAPYGGVQAQQLQQQVQGQAQVQPQQQFTQPGSSGYFANGSPVSAVNAGTPASSVTAPNGSNGSPNGADIAGKLNSSAENGEHRWV